MSLRDFRTRATLIHDDILFEAGILDADRSASGYQPAPLQISWPLVCTSIANATQPAEGEPDLDLLKRLLRAKVIPRLFSLVLDYPAQPVSDLPALRPRSRGDAARALENLDVSRVL